jgi:hypothetical protein
MWKILTSLAIGVLLLSPNATGAADFPSARGTIRLEYERGLLSAEIAQAPLADVLAALRQLSGLRVRTLGGLPTDSPVSTTVHAAPLVEGVRKILGDRSYVLQVDGDELSVQLLLGPETDHGASSPAAPAGAAERHGPRPVSSAPDALAPLAWQDPADRAEDIAQTGDGARTRQAEGQVEARLTRALAALRSDQARGHGEALDQLAYSTDARAIEVLKEVALGTLEVAPAVRVHAVAALARHALQRTSSDSTLLPVLEQLADNGDAAVSAVARQTLEDLWRQEP